MVFAGRNADTVRRSNLSGVLRLVHHSGGISRSEITSATGLTRSTVAVLVGELVDLGLVAETDAPSTNRVGRPSPLVVPTDGPLAIAVNPELDAVTIGVVGLSARVRNRVRREVDWVVTPEQTVEIVAEAVEGLAAELAEHERLVGIGVAVPGLVRSDGLVRLAPHLDWREAPIAELLAERLGMPAAAGNDASLGALAERLFGVGRGVADMVYLNGGASGIGGGVIAGGVPLAGASGYAGEFGQNRPGLRDAADRRTADGVLEDEVSLARLLEAARSGPVDEVLLADLLLGSDDDRVRDELARQRRVLAVALGNAVNVLNPALVVLGGFLATLHQSDPDDLRAQVAASSFAAPWSDTDIRAAALGADRLLIGAAELAFEALLDDPLMR